MKAKSIHRGLTTIAFLVIIFLLSSTQSGAQGSRKEPEERAKVLTEKMKTELSLTDEQVPKVEAINLKYAQKNSGIMEKGGGKFAKFKSLKSSQKEKDKEMKAVLTADQYKKYRELVEDMEKKAKEKYEGRQG